MIECDVAIIGSGFGGSLLAMMARHLGLSVVLLEKGRHPRFAIGESSTPLANLLLEEIAREYGLPQILPLTKWGTWQKSLPELACGLKRGFSFYHHTAGKPFEPRADHANELLVAASPRAEIADTHWFRADFDAWFVGQARELGADYRDQVSILKIEEAPPGSKTSSLFIGEKGVETEIRARFIADASGPRGALVNAFRLPEEPFPNLPRTEGLFSHFRNVGLFAEAGGSASLPYPPDEAALHHVFAGGWIWVLRFNNGLTSAGVAASPELAKDLRLSEGAPAWDRLLDRLPSVKKQFFGATPEFPFIYSQKLPFLTRKMTGPSWALLPSAAGFVDPLLSTGFPLTLLGISRLGRILADHWQKDSLAEALQNYEETNLGEILAAEDLTSALYASMDSFPVFSALTLVYFAVASFSETARRLGKPELPQGFLLNRHPVFGPAFAEIAARARALGSWSGPEKELEQQRLISHIRKVIEPINVAGLAEPSRQNHYPALASDLLDSAHKLGASREDIGDLLKKCGFGS